MLRIEALLSKADQVHSSTVKATPPVRWSNYSRPEKQEAFRAAAVEAGVADQTSEMGFIVKRCMCLSGYGC